MSVARDVNIVPDEQRLADADHWSRKVAVALAHLNAEWAHQLVDQAIAALAVGRSTKWDEDTPLAECLPLRIANALEKYRGVHTLRQAALLNETQILSVDGLGVKACDLIVRRIQSVGLNLKTE